jgi:dihydrofolate synthase/folylpolyglutamate synthase
MPPEGGASRTVANWLQWLEGLHPRSWDLGLERVAVVAAELGVTRLPSIVVSVAGTNGKGSTVALLESCYRAGGYRTGAFSSPHIHRFNERIRLDGAEVTDEALLDAFERVDRARGEVTLTYFEFTTLAALVLFADAAPDAVFLEVGLGGRLDAVNATEPDVSVITTIDLDHQAWLGENREAIGAEKAGIARPGRPLVVGDPEPPASIASTAQGAEIRQRGMDFDVEAAPGGWHWIGRGGRVRRGLPPPALRGEGQLDNAATALAVVEVLSQRLPLGQQAIRRGLEEVRLPARFQILPGDVPLILDVAHNGQATGALARNLARHPCIGRTHAVVAMLADKDAAAALNPLSQQVDAWYPAALGGERGRDGESMAAAVVDAGGAVAGVYPDPAAALAAARQAAGTGDRILVFGSFQTVAAVAPAEA